MRNNLEISFAMRVTIPDHVMLRELDNESVILNVDTEYYFGLDDVGTRMITVLTNSENIQTAYDLLLEEYDVNPDVLRRDLKNLIERLAENGLVEIS